MERRLSNDLQPHKLYQDQSDVRGHQTEDCTPEQDWNEPIYFDNKKI